MTGVSVRTLHYYDEIGLLKPSCVDQQNGYRYYDETALSKLQQILFYRELDFTLKEILQIISNPNYDKNKALSKQKRLLTLKKQRTERLIKLIDKIFKEESQMSFNEFDNKEYDKLKNEYAKEAKKRWGNTDSYKESIEKTSVYSNEQWKKINGKMQDIFKEFSAVLNNGASPENSKSQELVKTLQDFISEYHYKCSDEILKGLGTMYVLDQRFKDTIDSNGEGTAEFVKNSIDYYCAK